MHFFKTIITSAILGAFFALAAPAPEAAPVAASAPEIDARVVTPQPLGQAVINVYSSGSCAGSVQQFTSVTGTRCQPVTNAASVIVNFEVKKWMEELAKIATGKVYEEDGSGENMIGNFMNYCNT
ncbi:MAG: hypothetical protein Q9208_006384 [Pyrenodesmia sp. 3 TL-2023]